MAFRVRTIFEGVTGSPWLSTLHFADAGVGSPSTVNTDVGTFWAAVDNFMGSAVTWRTTGEVESFDVATGQVTAVTNVTPATGAGSVATDLLSPLNQALIKLRTGNFINGREVRGRIFVPGLTETGNDSTGRVHATTRAGIDAAAAALIASANSDFVVWSRTYDAVPAVTSAITQSTFAKLTSRRD